MSALKLTSKKGEGGTKNPALFIMLYLSNGYLDTDKIIEMEYPFIFVIGGRGVGKTYGALRTAVEKYPGRFQLMRRTQTELDNISNDVNSPFKVLNSDFGYGITVKARKNHAVIYDAEANIMGQMVALSTVSNIRGFDASDIALCIYDEFIPEAHKAPIKNEHLAFLNYYETVNRNRELQGKPPLKMRAFSNANDIMNPLIVGLGLVTPLSKMRQKQRDLYIDKERGYVLIDLINSPISKKKSETALYKFAGEGEFKDMSINNDFNSPLSTPKSRPLKEYIPVLSVGEIGLYKHKSIDRYYVSHTKSGTVPRYELSDTELKRLRLNAPWAVLKYFTKKIDFETSTAEILFLRYWKIIT